MQHSRFLILVLLSVGAMASSLFLGVAAGDTSDITATWNCCGSGGAASQDFLITSSGGALSGTAKLPSGLTFANISGSQSGSAVTIITTYTALQPGYVATFVGTLATDALTITGTWSDTLGQQGSFTATRNAPFQDPLPVPDASKRVSRIVSLGRQDDSKNPVGGTVMRDGKTYPLGPDSVLQVGDVVHTDANTLLAMEFLIGGRMGMSTDVTVRITGDRSVQDLTPASRRRPTPVRSSTWMSPRGLRDQPLEIQTNGGTLGGVRG